MQIVHNLYTFVKPMSKSIQQQFRDSLAYNHRSAILPESLKNKPRIAITKPPVHPLIQQQLNQIKDVEDTA